MVFAVVDIAGFQEKVSEGAKLQVPFLEGKKEGEKITFQNVLLLSRGENDVKIGNPYLSGSTVEAKVLGHGKGDKIRVFKMKIRKRYRRTQGHRQRYTEIEVTKLNG